MVVRIFTRGIWSGIAETGTISVLCLCCRGVAVLLRFVGVWAGEVCLFLLVVYCGILLTVCGLPDVHIRSWYVWVCDELCIVVSDWWLVGDGLSRWEVVCMLFYFVG